MGDHALDMPVQFLPGVGPVRARELAQLGVSSVRDLLEHFPFRYECRPRSKPIGHLVLDESATVVGRIRRVRSSSGLRKGSVVADVEDGTGLCRVRWFNSGYLRDTLTVGANIRVTGKVTTDQRIAVFVNPVYRLIEDGQPPLAEDRDEYEPIYPATAALPSKAIARVVRAVLRQCGSELDEFLPARLRNRRELPSRPTSIARVHHPVTLDDVPVARRRLAYDEFLLMQLAVQMHRRRASQANDSPVIRTTETIDQRIRARLPFAMTAAQDRAAAAISRDLASSRPMNRLLQGDVGAGKTAVAVYAALTTIANRFQVAMLAPTEVLARQLHERLSTYLQGSRVRIELLVGGLPAARRKALLQGAADGEIDLVVGTHALIEEDVRFRRLGLAVIDEQHRFGVGQREALRAKGLSPHYLAMSATPIPRSLAMTLYGDLDVTVIDELPPGRQAVHTLLFGPKESARAWEMVLERLRGGEQAFVVYPLVSESEMVDLKAATTGAEELKAATGGAVNVGLLHGQMTSDEKEAVVRSFRAGEVQVLVTTTVIEVGIDVPAATLMVIEHAERFGLSQLHQLRGRVGRGERASHCFLLSPSVSDRARERLAVLCSTSDGFEIAEADLRMRGPGELMGTRQHGLPAFKAADLLADLPLLEQARDDAAELLSLDPELQNSEHLGLREALTRTYRPLTNA